ncbi:nitroreductase/quinone reductase family protein [Nocardia sp. XZ_19_385]|uniref:nitroreductase/quinone reductase family protein n=1 Tax=Nocardia sp. XZ_19_385 TaxID=2769488 RepID=UPI00188EF9EC|nr:nitroreductase/quinone reductase family protein [Nocardia sp. XZ_19_385]
MPSRDDIQHRVVTTLQRRVFNPLIRRAPVQQLLETVGRVSKEPRITPIGGRKMGNEFWLVSEYGERSQYVRNIKADNRVRVRDRGRWYTGTAHLLPDDDCHARLRTLPRYNSTVVRLVGTDMLTVRIDLDQ